MGWESPWRLRTSPPRQRLNVQFNNGEHGFHNEAMDMKTIFRAVGPSFRRGLEVEPFESVHVYELMCHLLGIVPEANDGLLSTLLPTLREASNGTQSTPSGKGLPFGHSASSRLEPRFLSLSCTPQTSQAPGSDKGRAGGCEQPWGARGPEKQALCPQDRPPGEVHLGGPGSP